MAANTQKIWDKIKTVELLYIRRCLQLKRENKEVK